MEKAGWSAEYSMDVLDVSEGTGKRSGRLSDKHTFWSTVVMGEKAGNREPARCQRKAFWLAFYTGSHFCNHSDYTVLKDPMGAGIAWIITMADSLLSGSGSVDRQVNYFKETEGGREIVLER